MGADFFQLRRRRPLRRCVVAVIVELSREPSAAVALLLQIVIYILALGLILVAGGYSVLKFRPVASK